MWKSGEKKNFHTSTQNSMLFITSESPNDVNKNVKEAHTQVRNGQLLDEEIHARFTFIQVQCDKDCRVSQHNHSKKNP